MGFIKVMMGADKEVNADVILIVADAVTKTNLYSAANNRFKMPCCCMVNNA